MKKLLVLLFLAFSLNAFSQIPCVVIEWNEAQTSYSVVNFNFSPLFLPVIGLSPNLEILVKRYPYAIPEYDSRLKILGVTHSISTGYDTTYTSTRMWLETYHLIDRTVADKITSVNEAENWANYQIFPTQKHLKYIALALAILDKKTSGLTISTKEQIILNRVNAKALRIWQNHINANQMIDSLNVGSEVNLDLDWEINDPENE